MHYALSLLTMPSSKLIFTEEFCQPEDLFPFTLTRQVQDIRVGILTIREKWERYLGLESMDKWEDDYKDLDRSFRIDPNMGEDTCLMVHGNVLPSAKLVKAISKLKDGEFISVNGNAGIAFRFSKKEVVEPHKIKVTRAVTVKEEAISIRFPWDIFLLNGQALNDDFELITKKRKTQKIPGSNKLIKPSRIFIEKGVTMENCILNATEGPIYIGKNAMVMEGSMIRGPVAICEGATVKMGATIYGATTIGPYCVVGGEIKNSVFFGNSNKAHHGYVGDSVIGEWCNLGAGTSNSNMKNTAGHVKVWTKKGEMDAGLKCGMFIGDYSRTAINSSVNTGTVIGVSCNVFGAGLTPRYIPNFSWGNDGLQRYSLDKALADIENWKKLKHRTLTDNEKTILKYIFEHY